MPSRSRLARAAAVGLLAAAAVLSGAGAAAAQTLLPADATLVPAAVETAPQPAEPLVEVPEPPDVAINVTSEDSALSRTVIVLLMLTVGAVAPGVLLLMTSFTRFVIVLGLTRNAIGAQAIPPNQVLIGLALILTFFVMGPVLGQVNDDAVQPMLAGEIDQGQALAAGYEPVREFMMAQTDEDDLRLFMGLSGQERPQTAADVEASTLIPAFVLSELRTAFVIGFVIFVPFLVIDLIVSAVLMSLGMVMLPPVFISLPLKLLLFVMVDGWSLIVGSVVSSVNGIAA